MTLVSLDMAYRSFRGGSGRLDTRLDTPPSINRRHPDSGLAPITLAESLRRASHRFDPPRMSLSSSTRVTCAAYCRAIFDIIMTPARISRSIRTAHGLVARNFPPLATLLPSPRSAVCIIAMSVEPREIGTAAGSSLSPPNCSQFIFEQGHPET
jgi:hypothetical protein